MNNVPRNKALLQLLSVVIPAQNEEDCVVSTVERFYLELRLHNIPHEIIVVDDGQCLIQPRAAFLPSYP